MSDHVILLSIPGLRAPRPGGDAATCTRLDGGRRPGALVPSFPAVTWPVQANMLTGKLPARAWRRRQRLLSGATSSEVEMWTAWNDKIQRPQIWDLLHQHDPSLTSAVWFPMLSKGCGADYICMPAPIHNPDGSESLWCYTKPTKLYGDAARRARPLSAEALLGAAGEHQIDRLDRRLGRHARAAVPAATSSTSTCRISTTPRRKLGPDSPPAIKAVAELDEVIGTAGRTAASEPTHGRDLRLAGRQRVRHHAGRSRDVSQPRAARGGPAGRRDDGGRRAARFRSTARPGRWSIISSRTSS